MKTDPVEKKPLWREEFSIFNADEKYVSRRQLTKFLTLTSLGMFAGNIWILAKSWMYKEPAYPVKAVAKLAEIPVGGVKLFQYPGPEDQCILVRTAEDAYVAYSQKCTHLSCAVFYSKGNQSDRVPMPRGLLLHKGWFRPARSADAPAAARGARAQRAGIDCNPNAAGARGINGRPRIQNRASTLR